MSELEARTQLVGVVLPVHNEEDLLGDCLHAIAEACAQVEQAGISCRTAIVLDRCVDASAKISRDWVRELRRRGGIHQAMATRRTGAGVGSARRTGSFALLRQWSGTDPRRIWLATTDADSIVPENWLTAQVTAHEGGADIWSGRVSVEDWSHFQRHTKQRWNEAYESEVSPIHGANLGFNAQAYLESGGFAELCSGEDRALYGAIVARGGRVFEDDEVKVKTSGRRHGRAPSGFSGALASLEIDLGVTA